MRSDSSVNFMSWLPLATEAEIFSSLTLTVPYQTGGGGRIPFSGSELA